MDQRIIKLGLAERPLTRPSCKLETKESPRNFI
jgi:hypothetical protein